MLGFLIRGEVRDDAVRVKTLADMATLKYCSRPFSDACSAIRAEFGSDKCYIDPSYCSFVHVDLPEFQFTVHAMMKNQPLSLSAMGRGRYAGFLLQTIDGGKSWHVSVSDGVLCRATGGAKMMVQVMERKFGARNTTKMLKSIGAGW